MPLDLLALRKATLYLAATPPQIRVRLRVPAAQHSELVEELLRLAQAGTLRRRDIVTHGWSVAAFEWGGA